MTSIDNYFPALFLVPDFDGDRIECPPFRIAKRLWGTSTFDLATLATKHNLQARPRFLGCREDEHAGNVFVETMHRVNPNS